MPLQHPADRAQRHRIERMAVGMIAATSPFPLPSTDHAQPISISLARLPRRPSRQRPDRIAPDGARCDCARSRAMTRRWPWSGKDPVAPVSFAVEPLAPAPARATGASPERLDDGVAVAAVRQRHQRQAHALATLTALTAAVVAQDLNRGTKPLGLLVADPA